MVAIARLILKEKNLHRLKDVWLFLSKKEVIENKFENCIKMCSICTFSSVKNITCNCLFVLKFCKTNQLTGQQINSSNQNVLGRFGQNYVDGNPFTIYELISFIKIIQRFLFWLVNKNNL